MKRSEAVRLRSALNLKILAGLVFHHYAHSVGKLCQKLSSQLELGAICFQRIVTASFCLIELGTPRGYDRNIGTRLAFCSTTRRVVTLFVLLMAASEIFACQLISPDSCIFSSHSTSDSDEGGSGDGCLCCCAHIVVAAPIQPLTSLGFISQTIPVEDIKTPEVLPSGIEHPPRF